MKYFFQLFIVLTVASCTVIPKTKPRNTVRIPTGPGPEDIVIDTISTPYPRLLASCHQRRSGQPAYSEICEVNLNNDSFKIVKRTNEPQGMVFRPHGIDLVKNTKGELLLYCVSHNDEQKEHSIIIYKVFADYLEFKEKLDSPLLVSPNDITASCTGELFVTNDAGKRGSAMEQLLKLGRSNVISYEPETKQWRVVATGVTYANGIALNRCMSDYVVVFSTVRSNKLYMLKPSKINTGEYTKRTIARLKGLDNITFINENELLVTAHLRQIAYIKHFKDPKNIAPTVVYRVNIQTGEHSAVYSNDGSAICGGSTALLYKGKMYIAQVFEPFLLKCDAEDIK
jgi:hypothetical protein